MDYVVIGILVLIVILLIILLIKKGNKNDVNESNITERLGKLELEIVKELGDFKSNINKELTNDFDKVNDVWSLDFLDAGQSAVLKIKSISKKVGVAKNEVVATNDNFDPDLSNNNASVSVDVSKKQKSNSTSDEGKQKQSDGELKEGSYSILEENKSGNPLMVIVLLFVFTMGAIYGNTFLKKR